MDMGIIGKERDGDERGERKGGRVEGRRVDVIRFQCSGSVWWH